MLQLPDALAPLNNYRQFILWTTVERDGKLIKLPVNYQTAAVTDAHDAQAWTDAETAINAARLFGDNYGVGFVFTVNDPFYFIDIDKCSNNAGGWSDTANVVMSYFPDAAVEVSQSGTGLHIFGTYTTMPDHACKNIPLGLEFYTEGRFVALTGTNIIGHASTNGDQYLQSFINNYMAPRVVVTPETWTTAPVAGCNPLDDEALIKKALGSKSAAGAFGVRATFRNLWERDVEALAAVWEPDASDTGEFDESSADMALAQHLAFWTGKNCEAIERLMWLSGLTRDKWTKHKNYLRGTIMRAVSLQPDDNTYKGAPPKVSLEKAAPVQRENIEPGLLSGFRYLAGPQQIEHFKGCVYVQDLHRVFTPRGAFLKPDQFNATYGGYVFALDDTNRKETKKAWEAFTESQVVEYKQAETTCFNPQLPTGAFTTYDDKVAVNIYVPTNTPRVAGDPTRFLNHLAKVLPDEGDRAIILAYMAACIQHKGVKFQWAPLLQGMEGNGKTLFTRCVAFAIGERFTHMPPAEQLAEKYNEWLYGTLFIGVEDIYVPDHKLNVIEVLKPMITNDRHAIRAMGVAQVMRSICCNFMFNSNHKDAVRKTRRDRRFAIFYTAQQNDGDLERDGMGGDYFPDLYKWLKNEDGYAIVANYLETYQIPDELNPATSCHRAPPTSSTDEVIEASLGGIEQEILEAIEQGRPGFAGGWISSTALEVLLDNLHATRSMPQNKRKQMLNDMGYYWHPNLKNGRVNNHIMMDNGKPKLYVKKGHIALNLKTCAEISKAYQDAQGGQAIQGSNAAANAFGKET
ncbi:MAG: hypothetical protein K0U20_08780 [Proteobacteria bacterium]|nr:hypothetical protein [Pseudomonadota bacterium]